MDQSNPMETRPRAASQQPVPGNEWWRGAVIYQIYPRSFYDSNADGVGDLPGITQKLPYVASLGVDAIWLSPFFASPMKDFGYDVADYCAVDPLFGTLDDFKALLHEAHRLGLKVIIDQVYSHTSDQHPWFSDSRSGRSAAKAEWYVWADARADGTPPNNWLSIFGGSAWQWDSHRKQYYLHNFLASQPDLNFHHPEVQQAILDCARFWLDLGVDGFRLDVVNFYFHDAALSDNPPALTPEQRFVGVDDDNLFSRQFHCHQIGQVENLAFLRRLRAVMDDHGGRFTVGEIGAPQALQVMAEYTAGGDKLHSAYTFELLGERHDAPYLRTVLQAIDKALDGNGQKALQRAGWPCFALSNHDVTRSASRWSKDIDGTALDQTLVAKVSLAFLFSLRGSACLYQGEELGLEQAEVPFAALQDPFGKAFWPAYQGRDGCRTPFPWQDDGGFTRAPRSWLPLYPPHCQRNRQRQEQQADSVLNFVRHFLCWRRQHPALIRGGMNWPATMDSDDPILSFMRCYEGRTLFAAFNLTARPRRVTIPGTVEQVLVDHGLVDDSQLDNRQANHTAVESAHQPTVVLPPLNAIYAYITV